MIFCTNEEAHDFMRIESAVFEQLRPLTKRIVADADFDALWQRVINNFEAWESGPIGQRTSGLNGRLEFLRNLSDAFPNRQFNRVAQIVDVVLFGSGVKDTGDTFKGKTPTGRTELLKVIRREITDEYGILYTLETPEGFQFTHEFFD